MARTVVFFLWFWASLLLGSPLCLLFLILDLLGLAKPFRPLLLLSVRAWARSVAAAAGMRIECEGEDRVPASGPLCLVGNHEGYMDIILVLACSRRLVGFVAKAEGLFVPLLNIWVLALGSVFLDRKHVGRAMRAIEGGVRRIRAGGALCVFPEGTRSRGGQLGLFRPGSFKLATKSGAPVLPFTLSGTSRVWEAFKRITPTTVRLVFHEPIPTAGLSPEGRKALPGKVRALIGSKLTEGGFPT